MLSYEPKPQKTPPFFSRNKTISNLSSRLSQYSASKIREQALTNNSLSKNKSILKKTNSLTFSRNVSFLLEDEQVWTNSTCNNNNFTVNNNDSVLTKVSSDIDCLSNGWNVSSGTNTNCSFGTKTNERKAKHKKKNKKKRRYFFKNKNTTQNMTKKQVNTVYNPTVAAYGKIFNAQVLNTRKYENNENSNISNNFDKFNNNKTRNFGNNDEEKFLQAKNAISTKYTSSSYSYYNNDVHHNFNNHNESTKFLSPDVTDSRDVVVAEEQRYFASSGTCKKQNLSLENYNGNNRHLKLTKGKTLTDGVCDDVVRETRGLDYGYSFGDIGYSISQDNEEFNSLNFQTDRNIENNINSSTRKNSKVNQNQKIRKSLFSPIFSSMRSRSGRNSKHQTSTLGATMNATKPSGMKVSNNKFRNPHNHSQRWSPG